MCIAKYRIVLHHRCLHPKFKIANPFKSNRYAPYTQPQHDTILSPKQTVVQVQPRRCPERGMPGKWQFFLRREDPHAHSLAPFHLRIVRQYKRCFRKIGFTRQRLHPKIGQARCIMKNSQRIALKRLLRKNIQHRIVQSSQHFTMLPSCDELWRRYS